MSGNAGPPHSVDAEQAVLGGLMLDNATWGMVADRLTADDFYRRDHQVIFAAIGNLAARSEPLDAVTVAEQLERMSHLEDSGGLPYLANLARETPSASNIGTYAYRVYELSVARKARTIGAQLSAARSHEDICAHGAALSALVQSSTEALKPSKRLVPYLSWSQLSGREPPQRTWFIKDWLTTGGTLLAGRGGVGKTSLAQAIASSLSVAKPYLSPSAERAAVNLMWACEDDGDELWRRQVPICAALGIDMAELEDMFYLESRFGADNILFAPVMGRMQWTPSFDLLKEQVNDTCADVLWLDNIGHTFAGNESERSGPTAFINGLVGMRPGLAVVLLGHPARSSASEFAGSAAWENAVRSRWYFGDKLPDQEGETGEPDDTIRFLCRRKANYTFRDYLRLKFFDGVFMPDQPEGLSMSEKYGGGNRQDSADVIVVEGFNKCVAAGITPTDGHTSGDYLPTRLMNMQLNAGFTKKELASAMNRLLRDGRLKRAQVGMYSNRTPRFGLVKS